VITQVDIIDSGGRFPGRIECATEEICVSAKDLAGRVTILLERAGFEFRRANEAGAGVRINSGLRTPDANVACNGAKHSAHLEGKAVDLRDNAGLLTSWIVSNESVLEELGLWMESPNATHVPEQGVRWVHLQIARGPLTPAARIFDPITGLDWLGRRTKNQGSNQ
jgi:hypothetical protein